MFKFEEDYRWKVLRKQTPKWQMKILNLAFISVIQNLLLFIASLPQYLLLTTQYLDSSEESGSGKLNSLDWILVFLLGVTLTLEMIADNQQQRFQASKYSNQLNQQETQRGFVTSGLWFYSRHPNVACEQLVWYILYGFTVSATFAERGSYCWGTWINYSIASPISMSALLYPAAVFTESISSSKYPTYLQYQKNDRHVLATNDMVMQNAFQGQTR